MKDALLDYTVEMDKETGLVGTSLAVFPAKDREESELSGRKGVCARGRQLHQST